jgi:hypothetical protein
VNVETMKPETELVGGAIPAFSPRRTSILKDFDRSRVESVDEVGRADETRASASVGAAR